MSDWHTSKKYPGVRWRFTSAGEQTFYITYKVSGKLRWEKVGTKKEGYSAALTAEFRTKKRLQLRHGDDAPEKGASLTFGKIAERYIEWAKNIKATWKEDERRWEKHLKPKFAELEPKHIRITDLEKFQIELSKKELAPATIRHMFILFGAIWNRGREWELIKLPNPVKKIKLPKLDNTRERSLTPDEVQALLDRVKTRSPLAYGLTLMSYNTGARRGELFSLHWGDVDFNNETVVFRNTKNGRTRRVPLNERAAEYLKSKKLQKTNDLVFTQEDGKPLRYPGSAYQRAADVLFNEGVDNPRHKVVFHTLRHSFASRLVSRGTPLNVVQELLGHSSLAMLQRYSHLAPGAERKAVALLL
jgi:integrase